MKPLAASLSARGHGSVQTLLQSGNVVLSAKSRSATTVCKAVELALREDFDLEVPVVVRGESVYRREVQSNPFGVEAEEAPATVHLFFRRAKSKLDVPGLDAAAAKDERWVSVDNVVYLHAPSGVARSKLVARPEKWMGCVTARNARTAGRLVALLDA